MPVTKRFIASKAVTPTTALRADFSLPSTPTSLAKQSTAGARALVDTGQTLQKVGGDLQRKADKDKAVEKELARRNQNAIDSTSKAQAGSATRVADTKIKDAINNRTKHTDEWDAVHSEFYDDAMREIEALPATPAAKQSMLTELKLSKQESFAKLQLLKATTNVDNAEIANSSAYESEIVNNGGPVAVAETGGAYFEALTAKYGPEGAEEIFNKKTEKAHVERKKKLNNDMRDQAVNNPDLAIPLAEAEIQRRKVDQGQIPEDDITSQQLHSIIQLAESRNIEKKRDQKAIREQAQKNEENNMYDGLNDGTKSLADVTESKILDAAQKRRLTDDYTQMNKMDIAQTWPLADNDDVVQGLNTKLTDEASGIYDIQEMNASINAAAASGKLTEATRNKMRAQAKKGGLDAIDEQVNASTLRVKNALVGRLSEREARFKARALGRELTVNEQREAGSVGFLLQVSFEQLNRFNAELNKRMREKGKETLSGTDVEALSAEVWEKYKNKGDAQRIREFQEFTGRKVPQPEGVPDKVWNKATPADRSNITVALSKGMTIQQVLDMVGE